MILSLMGRHVGSLHLMQQWHSANCQITKAAIGLFAFGCPCFDFNQDIRLFRYFNQYPNRYANQFAFHRPKFYELS